MLLDLLNAFDNRFQALADKTTKEISWKQFFAIICINLCKSKLTVKELAEIMGSSHQNVKQILLKLEKKRFDDMSNGIILYQSKYGATKKYVDWLKEETGYDCIETKNVKLSSVQTYGVVVLGGGVYASGIAGLQFLKKNMSSLSDKKVAVFAVGASPYDEKAIMQIRELHFKDVLSDVPLFYCRGAWDEKKMTFGDRTLCKMLQKAVAKQNPEEYEPWQKALMCAIGQKCDWTNRMYLEPLLKYLLEQ